MILCCRGWRLGCPFLGRFFGSCWSWWWWWLGGGSSGCWGGGGFFLIHQNRNMKIYSKKLNNNNNNNNNKIKKIITFSLASTLASWTMRPMTRPVKIVVSSRTSPRPIVVGCVNHSILRPPVLTSVDTSSEVAVDKYS